MIPDVHETQMMGLQRPQTFQHRETYENGRVMERVGFSEEVFHHVCQRTTAPFGCSDVSCIALDDATNRDHIGVWEINVGRFSMLISEAEHLDDTYLTFLPATKGLRSRPL